MDQSFHMSSSSMISSFEVLWSAGRIRGSVGDTCPMIGEGKSFAIGSTRVAVSTIVCTTEGCIDSMSPTRRFLRGGAKFGGHEVVESPDESS